MRVRKAVLVLSVLAAIACTKETRVAEPPVQPSLASKGLVPPAPRVDAQASLEAPPAAVTAPEGMVLIPGGSFAMGLPESLTGGRAPERTTVKPFFLDRLEVAAGAYLECVKSGACTPTDKKPGCNLGAKKPRSTHPANCLTKPQAERYCASVGKRLPTAAEWEFAARGTDGRVYPWGNEAPAAQLCWQGNAGAEDQQTCAVGSFPQGASPFGVLDMAGNVAEWTSTNDNGPKSYFVRGGGFSLSEEERMAPEFLSVRADRPTSYLQDDVYVDTGVRCARDL